MEIAPRKIELWEVSKLIPYEKNAKVHDPAQVESLAHSISKFGWTQPIVIWTDGTIIIGHGRREAALKLGLTKVPVDVRSDLTKAEADALRLADNRVTSTTYNQALIQDELQRLSEELLHDSELITINDLGFTAKELDFSLSDLGEMDSSFFTDDIGAATEEQKSRNVETIARTDDTAAPVADALGFKRVTIAQSRELKELMRGIETVTALKGVDALIAFARDNLPK